MDIKKATSVQMVSPKYGFAVFETDWEDKPCQPTVHFLIKCKSGNFQMTPGWYMEDLLKKPVVCKDMFDENEVGLYIDFGQNWFIPAGPISCAQGFFREYQKGARFNEVLNGKVW